MGLFSRRKDGAEPDAVRRPARARESARAMREANDTREPLDPAETQKRRARRRLIGAIVLVLGVIVFLPMVFDPGPKPLADDIVVQIPDKETPFNPVVPAKAPAKAVEPVVEPAAPAPVPGKVAEKGAEPGAEKAPVPASATAPEKVPVKGAEKAPEKAPAKIAEKVPEKVPEKAPEKSAAKSDEARAVALLEGKGDGGRDPARAEAVKHEGWAVQLGAFASADKVRDLRGKLNPAGLKSYTETVKTPQGDRIRVRVGPFPTRDAAEKARERVRKHLVIDGVVVAA